MKKFLICLTLLLSFNSAYADENPHSAVYNGDQIFHSNYESKWSLIDINTNDKLILTKVASFLKHQKSINFYKGTGIFYIDECITLKKKNNNKNKNAK